MGWNFVFCNSTFPCHTKWIVQYQWRILWFFHNSTTMLPNDPWWRTLITPWPIPRHAQPALLRQVTCARRNSRTWQIWTDFKSSSRTNQVSNTRLSGWRHDRETLCALLALWECNPQQTMDSPPKRLVMRSFPVFVVVILTSSWINSQVVGNLRRRYAHVTSSW